MHKIQARLMLCFAMDSAQLVAQQNINYKSLLRISVWFNFIKVWVQKVQRSSTFAMNTLYAAQPVCDDLFILAGMPQTYKNIKKVKKKIKKSL